MTYVLYLTLDWIEWECLNLFHILRMDAEFFLFSFIYLLKMGSEANSCISNKFPFGQPKVKWRQPDTGFCRAVLFRSPVAISLILSKQETPGIHGLTLHSSQLPFSPWMEYNTEFVQFFFLDALQKLFITCRQLPSSNKFLIIQKIKIKLFAQTNCL